MLSIGEDVAQWKFLLLGEKLNRDNFGKHFGSIYQI